jgi:DNA-binding CsgD family transcriptional regulator
MRCALWRTACAAKGGGTVKVHIKHRLKKLTLQSSVAAAAWAAEQGLRWAS